nr:amyloid protein-binding protein 2-like isoform X1 [Aotus nancymaae]
MAAVELEWIPETLYNTAISAVVDNYIRSRRDIRSLPENIQFDVYYKVCAVGLLSALRPQPRGPHPLPRLRTPAVNPSPLAVGLLPKTFDAVSALPVGKHPVSPCPVS